MSIYKVKITPHQALSISDAVRAFGPMGNRPRYTDLEKVREAMAGVLAPVVDQVREAIANPRTAAMLVCGVGGLDDPLPRTPVHELEAPALHSNTFLAGMQEHLGRTMAYDVEQSGCNVHSLVVRAGYQHTLTGLGGAPLGFHQDLVALYPYNQTVLPLLCLRPGPPVPTDVALIDAALPLLKPWEVDLLQEPGHFSVAVPYAFEDAARGTTRAVVHGPPLVFTTDGVTEGRLVLYGDRTQPHSDRAAVALGNLRKALARVSEPVLLQPGQMALILNRRAVHARGAVPATFQGCDRWLLRGGVIDEPGYRGLRPFMDDLRPVVDTRAFFWRSRDRAA